jgi:NADPH-dependent glutamate synthase beta subunit-like oxidoreductase/predicted nucleotide-binding protein (sugar kinase/HSP70/actin superfamily)/NAD-dependent dihydropyrimidine dehydrogenase PreA subunit
MIASTNAQAKERPAFDDKSVPAGFDRAAELSDLEAELDAFERQEKERLGLPASDRHWRDSMVNPQFKKSERENTTLLVSGLTAAHDHLVKAALRGLGYNVEVIDVPDNDALRYGKEFGNRGQCNPTYFTVGNLVKHLTLRCRDEGISQAEAVQRYVFLTAGACGPCRCMYATEYRKALRDAGFDGFRVMLFQQQGGLAQATGEDSGLEFTPRFFIGLLLALMAGDVLNGIGYRVRPFEVEPGSTDRALATARGYVQDALSGGKFLPLVLPLALWKARKELAAVKCDFTRPLPRVSIIGEFWAMTTEGDGNYKLQRFLESEGAECDIQLVTNWLLYNVWEARYDTRERAYLRGQDTANASYKGNAAKVELHRLTLWAADQALRGVFQAFAGITGFAGYKLPDMDEIASIAHQHYDNRLRGGEGHMEVGKFILNVLHNKSHMTLSVKPFGCMPSSGISDGVQSLITARFPQSLFCAIETSGDGKVNVQSRVQMSVFKARQKAVTEYQETMDRLGMTPAKLQSFFAEHPRYASPLHRSPHGGAGTAVDRLIEVEPLVGKSKLQVRVEGARRRGRKMVATARDLGKRTIAGAKHLRAESGTLWTRLKDGFAKPAADPSPVPPAPDKPMPVRSSKLTVMQGSAEAAPVELRRPAPAPRPPEVKVPPLPVSEPSTDPASALSVARGVGTAPRDFHWLKENIPCQAACPAHTDIPAYLKAIGDGRYREAYEINLRDNVFPGVMGRVCSRPCEAACRHGWEGLGEPVAICWSKRASSDLHGDKPVVLPPLAGPTGKRVVVVGAGPAGLAAARNLALLGHQVVVLEQHSRPGGMMIQDIPEFRLPRHVVDLEIEQIRLTGVEIRCGVALGRDVTLAELEASYDAVVLAAGTFRPNYLDLPGKDLAGIQHGLDFLLRAGQGEKTDLGANVLVIGGGFTAMDCARTAARLGADTIQLGEAPGGRERVPALKLGAETVRVLYRRSKAEMLITPGEIDDLQHEGMDLEIMVAPVAYLAGDDGRVRGMRFVRTQMGATDASGRRKPEAVLGSEFELPASTVLLATGQFPDGTIVGRDGKDLVGKDGWLTSGAAQRTVRSKVFAAGDFATGARSLIDAIAHAKECANAVDEHLMGRRRVQEIALVEDARATPRPREMDAVPRRKMRLLPVLDRTLRAEVEQGFDRERAAQETSRCYLCHNKMEIDPALCTSCDLCLNVKPRADCIVKVSSFAYDDVGRITGFVRATDEDKHPRIWINQSDCIRCGACIDVCPDDAISVQKVSLKNVMVAKG